MQPAHRPPCAKLQFALATSAWMQPVSRRVIAPVTCPDAGIRSILPMPVNLRTFPMMSAKCAGVGVHLLPNHSLKINARFGLYDATTSDIRLSTFHPRHPNKNALFLTFQQPIRCPRFKNCWPEKSTHARQHRGIAQHLWAASQRPRVFVVGGYLSFQPSPIVIDSRLPKVFMKGQHFL